MSADGNRHNRIERPFERAKPRVAERTETPHIDRPWNTCPDISKPSSPNLHNLRER